MTSNVTSLEQVHWDLPCVGCGYNLRTLGRDGVCPECGTEVEVSWLDAPLSMANVKWLGQIRLGMTLILACCFLTLILAGFELRDTPTRFWWGTLTRLDWWLQESQPWYVAFILFCLGGCGLFYGTRQEPSDSSAQRDPASRRYCRAAIVAVGLLECLAWTWDSFIFRNVELRGSSDPYMRRAVHEVDTIIIMTEVGFILATWVWLTLYWRGLASRYNQGRLIRQTKFALWFIGIAALSIIFLNSSITYVDSKFSHLEIITVNTSTGNIIERRDPRVSPESRPVTTNPSLFRFESLSLDPSLVPSVWRAYSVVRTLIPVTFVLGLWWMVLVFRYRSMMGSVLALAR